MTEAAVRARVEAFIAGFYAAWRRSGRMEMPTVDPFTAGAEALVGSLARPHERASPDFASWDRDLATLVEEHFTSGVRTGAEGMLSAKPDHDPAVERIVGVEVRRARAEVHTVFPDGTLEHHFTYRLRPTDNGWRISKIIHTFAPAETRVMEAAEVARLLAGMDRNPAKTPVAQQLADGVTALFSDRYELIELGAVTTSGVLTVHDLGWVRHDLAPLNRRVRPGAYPVELARNHEGTNVGVRLRLSDRKIVTRLPAARVGAGGHIVGVDAGNVAIADFLALTSSSEGRVEEMYQDFMARPFTSGALFGLTGTDPQAVVVVSGHGDGAYPVHWGLDTDGELVDLAVDFLVDAEDAAHGRR